jgi:rod shape-determining protein MreD
MLWSLALLALEAIETRFPWRGFWQDWITATGLLTACLVIGAMISGGGIELWRVPLILPQLALSILLFPLIARMVAFFDRVRLIRIRVVD